MLKEGSCCMCLSVVLIDSVFKMSKNYYPQVFLKECKYIVKKKVTRNIIENLDISSDEENSDEKNLMKEIILKNNIFLKEQFA